MNLLAAKAELQRGKHPEEYSFMDLMCAINIKDNIRNGEPAEIKKYTKGRYVWQQEWIKRKVNEYL
ncbi:MAG: hypothetical protein NTY20_05095 [Candidatus Aenigmarchaeota archaeon]|nr:hypothetical protein [Candidatus Aenigmarchaeota archaeon]